MDATLELSKLLQKALELEHAAFLQYLSHAEVVTGNVSPGIIEQLRDNARDEASHASILRNLLGNYLDYYPSMSVDKTHEATNFSTILKTNIKDEQTATDHYKKTLQFIENNKNMKFYCTFWEAIR
jgi:bacterioferritin (cytochrome b1)